MGPLENAEKLAELASIGDRAVARIVARARLAELLEDDDPEVRAEAAGATRHYACESDLSLRLLELAKGDPSQDVRRSALESLGEVLAAGDLAGAEEGGYAPNAELGEPSSEVYEQTKSVLLEALAGGGPESATALEALAVLSQIDQVRAAIEALAGGDTGERALALRCVARSGDPRWEETIRAGLDAEDPAVVVQAIEAAGRAEITGAVPLLSRILRGDGQPQGQRLRAASALARLGGVNTAAVLLEVAEARGTDHTVREAAHRALADLTLLSSPPSMPEENA